MKLPLTIYQLYSWAVAADPSEILLTRTFCSGVSLLCYPTKYSASDEATISAQVLASMQSNALQLARLALSSPGTGSTMSSLLATSWAAQCALWQLKFLPDDPQRSMILPRLAESMTKKLVEQESSPSAEIQWIYLRALEQQSNHSDMLERLNQLLMDATAASHPTEFGVALTPNQILLEKAKVLCKLDQFEAASDIYEKLISRSPDDFSCWMQHLDCSFKSTGTIERTKTLVAEILDEQKDSKYPLRGPNLVKVELQARQLRTQGESDSGSAGLADAIKSYSETFASRVVCCFSDLENYLDLLSSHEATSNDHLVSLLDWIESCRIQNNFDKADTDSIRQNKLRAFICCCKMTHKLQSRTHDMDRNYLPPLDDLLEQWKFSLEFNKPAEGNETQKEIRPDDELLLVIVQQVLQAESCSPKSLVTAAALLEMAIKCSPYNSYLKICCIGIYHRLGATSRSWELFQGVGLKHIQLDSCTYVILPMLMSGGLFNEAIDACNAMIRFQAGTARETGDYAGRAMENGTLSKGNEFIEFQREKMNNSLTMLQAKAFILDAAPLLANPVSRKKFDEDPVLEGGLGTIQGIVGGESDVERATRMIPEVYNPNAALQVVSWADRNDAPDSSTQDNRDLSILSYETLVQGGVESKDDILKASRLCGHTHSLLILATLCIEATKAPKKGKLVKTSPELEKRTLGLLDMCDKCLAVAQNRFAGEGKLYDLRKSLVGITTDLCRTLALLVAGLPTRDREDTLDTREKAIVESLELVSGKVEPLSASLTAATIHDMFQILAHELVALFAIFRKLADVLSTFGWGKRKRKTKACAEAMAVLASHLEVTVTTLLSTLDRYDPFLVYRFYSSTVPSHLNLIVFLLFC